MHFFAEAEIITTDKIEDIEIEFALADNETLVIFDMDWVIWESTDRAFHADIREAVKPIMESFKKYFEKQNQDEKEALDAALWKIDAQPVDSKMPLLINVLQSRGIKTLLLTANLNGKVADIESVESLCYRKLKNFGIDFKQSWKNLNRIDFKETEVKGKKLIPFFGNGMIFTCMVPKGEILRDFLGKLPQYKFKKIVFIDDRMKNLESVRKVSEEIGIRFIGIEYTRVKTKKRSSFDLKKIKSQVDILMREKRWISDAEMKNYEKTPCDKMVEIIDFGVVKSCSGHHPTEEQIFAAVRKSVSEKDIPNDILIEYIDDFFEIRHKIYNIVGFACQLEFARKAYAAKIDMSIVLDCVNNNLFISDGITKISENIVKNANAQIREEILSAGCGSFWKDYAKYRFVRSKLFGKKNCSISYKQLPLKRQESYRRIIEKVYDYACESHALNCKYCIARNFIKHGIDKKIVCKIFDFTDDEYEDFVKPVN
jgi:hypothetical protein